MDIQPGVLDGYPPDIRLAVLDGVSRATAVARQRGNPVIYVRLAFRNDAPEVNPRNALFSRIVALDRFNEHDARTSVHPALEPGPDEVVVLKKRASAFSGSDLGVVLRSLAVAHLVLTGVATSGVVMSTLCAASDLDYELTVLRDACADHDDEVHRVLCEKVFPLHARVITVTDWANSS